MEFDALILLDQLSSNPIVLPNGFFQEDLQVLSDFLGTRVVNVSVHHLLVELVFANVLSYERPVVQVNSKVVDSFNYVDLIRISVELDNHGYVVVLSIGCCPNDLGGEGVTLVEQDVTRVCIL